MSKKLFEVIGNPDIPVGFPSDNPSEVTLTLLADYDINQNEDGEPTPIEVQVAFLNEDSKLLSYDFYEVISQPLDKLLGKNYIDHQDFTIEPGNKKRIQSTKLDPKTTYIAVIVYYSDPENTIWLDVLEVEGTGQTYNLLAHVRNDEVEIKK